MAGYDTIWPADTLEFCPHPEAQDIFVCGTYKLDDLASPSKLETSNDNNDESVTSDPTPQHRRGTCLVFQLDNIHADDESSGSLEFKSLQELDFPAIPDMKWCNTNASEAPVLAIADSEGNITLERLSLMEWRLEEIQKIDCVDSRTLCLSLDWSNRRYPSSVQGSLVSSFSDGSLSLLQPQDGTLSIIETWSAHDFEPWIAAWDYWDDTLVFSGGDDLKLKVWDIRGGFNRPIWTNKRFEAGVTTIQSHPFIEHLLAVGSYDGVVRLFDKRKPLVPLTTATVGGGVWRTKWHPSLDRREDLLVACMHDGFKVVHFGGLTDVSITSPLESTNIAEGQILQRFDEHKSLAYGVDWCYAPSKDKGTIIGSCSFYDHMMHLWKA